MKLKENTGVNERPKKIKKLKSTTTILWRYFVLFTLVILIVIGVVAYFIVGDAAMNRTKQRVNTVGKEFITIFSYPEVDDRLVIYKINSYTLSDSFDVFVFDPEGKLIFGTLTVSEDAVNAVYSGLSSHLTGWDNGKIVEYSQRYDGGVNVSFGACVEYRNMRCKMLVSYPVSPIAKTVRQMELYLVIVAAAALLLAFFISYTLANRLSKPIREVSETAQKLAEGDYSVEFNSVEYAEVAKLADTMNYMKDEIKKSDEFQKELLANVSHDLKTPLTMIKAYASMIKEISGDDPVKREKHTQVIIDEADRLAGLVNDILSTSKIRSGIEQLELKVFNLSEAVYGAINGFGYLQEGQGYKIMVDIDPNQYTSADEEKIKQVIYNLISNAVNYTGEDKTVYVSLKFVPQSNCLRFAVRDTGNGIPQEEIEHIWERYYRSNQTHNRPVKGTGLGLNIVKEILQKHAFNFGVTSGEGEGSTFFVDFPAVSSLPEKV